MSGSTSDDTGNGFGNDNKNIAIMELDGIASDEANGTDTIVEDYN